MLTTSPSSPDIHIPPPCSIPKTRSVCSLPRGFSNGFAWNSVPKIACFGSGRHHGALETRRIAQTLHHPMLGASHALRKRCV
jgi:hypothetical protein